jgi:hypothetical protein
MFLPTTAANFRVHYNNINGKLRKRPLLYISVQPVKIYHHNREGRIQF